MARNVAFLTLLLGAGCAARHPLEVNQHEIAWQKESPPIYWAAKKPHEGSPIKRDLDTSYVEFCLNHFADQLRRHYPEHAKMLRDRRPFAAELTGALRETGTAMFVVGDHYVDFIPIHFSTARHERFDFACDSRFEMIFCRFEDRVCGNVEGLRRTPKRS